MAVATMAVLMSTFVFAMFGPAPVRGSNDAKTAAKTAARWVKATNIYRCMNGVGEVGWSQAAADDAQTYLNNLALLPPPIRTNPYCLLPPTGPAGENIATGSKTLEDAVGSWYEESNNCISSTGCSAGINGTNTRHFTALVWKGVTQIGCAAKNSYYVCRYRSGDSLGPQSANMLGSFKLSVLSQTKTFSECQRTASGELDPALADPASLYPKVPQVGDAIASVFCPAANGRYIRRSGRTIAIISFAVIGAICCCAGVYSCRFISEKQDGLSGTLAQASRQEQNPDHDDWRYQTYAESQRKRVDDYGPIWSQENRDVIKDGLANSGIWG